MMANKTFQGRIVQKHDIEANWKKATNFIPLKGEIIVYDDLNKIKIGDGSTKINDLKFDTATFYVKVTQGTGNLATANKTPQEIYDAYQAGYAISAIAQFNNAKVPFILPLAAINKNDGIIIGFGALGSTSPTTAPQYPTVLFNGFQWQMWIGELVRNEDLTDVAKTGSYNDLIDKPTIPSISGLATETYVNTKIAGIVNSAPETLDTLQELARALGNDPNFATTVATEIGKKANSADLATVAKTGSYNDLINKRTINGSTNNIETTFYVNFTVDAMAGWTKVTSNKTIDEIKNAYNNGYTIIGLTPNGYNQYNLTLSLYQVNIEKSLFTFITLDGLYLIAIGNNGGDTWTAEQVTLVDQDSLDLPTEYTEDEITTIYNNIT